MNKLGERDQEAEFTCVRFPGLKPRDECSLLWERESMAEVGLSCGP